MRLPAAESISFAIVPAVRASPKIMPMHSAADRPDRRRAQRFRVALPVELTDGTAVTRDVSACGAFFETSRAFVVGECIQFTLILEHVDPGHQVHLRCRGQVVRVESGSTAVMGVAVAITGYRLDAPAQTGKDATAMGTVPANLFDEIIGGSRNCG